jgi:hypothetical protein
MRKAMLALWLASIAGCGGGFGAGNATSPGSTPNISQQTSYRIVGTIGTPFVATLSNTRSSWVLSGVIPMSIVVVNDKPPDRILVTKLSNDSNLLSVEIITGFDVKVLASTVDRYGVAVGAVPIGAPAQQLVAFSPPADPDVRFYVNGPAVTVYDALIEDEVHGNVVQSRAPSVILFDSPNSNAAGRVDGIFSEVNGFGPFSIDLVIDNVIAAVARGGSAATLKANAP